MSRSKEAWADDPFDGVTETDFPEPRASGDLPPEPGDERDDACPYCDSTNGFEAVGFGPDAPFVRCKNCGHMVTRG